jgi:hypothetical protein
MTRRAPLPLVLVLVLAACGHDSHHFHFDPGPSPGPGPSPSIGPRAVDEIEPNDGPGTATPLGADDTGRGELHTPGDVDCWSFSATAGEIVQIELLAVRLDHAGWDAFCNVPRLFLLAPDGSGLLAHDPSGAFSGGWRDGRHDLDFPCFRIEETGTHRICIVPDDPLVAGGEYALTVRSAGISPIVVEAEGTGVSGANETPATAQVVADPPLGAVTIRGFHVDGETDVFAIDVPTESLVYLEVKAYANGVYREDDDYYDPFLELLESDGTTVLDANGDAFFRDPALSVVVTVPGTYYVRLTQDGMTTGDAPYFLTYVRRPLASAFLESEPNDTVLDAEPLDFGDAIDGNTSAADPDHFRFAGVAGDMVRIEFFELENHQGATAEVDVEVLAPDGVTVLARDVDEGAGDLHFLRTILQQNGTHTVRVVGQAGGTRYAFALILFREARYETEPNDDRASADALGDDGAAAGVIAAAGDADFYRFQAASRELVTIDVFADRQQPPGSDGFRFLSGHGSALRPAVRIWSPAGALLAESTYSPPLSACVTPEGVVQGLPTVQASFVAPSAGTYTVEVTDEAGAGGSTFTYVAQRR